MTDDERDTVESLPAGAVTFLLTDVEGSTRLWEQSAAGMSAAMASHDAIVARAIDGHRGTLLKERGEGDSTFSVFADPVDAVSAAVELQRELGSHAWPAGIAIRVRASLHSGEAELRDRDYFGPTVNRAARIRSIGYGGHTLVSEATARLVADRMPDGVSLEDVGVHRLRDLERAERIHRLVHPGAPANRPPVRSQGTPLTNLPAHLTPFIGRAQEIEDVVAAVRRERLVTLTGSGGVGKTRLALEVASRMGERFPDGVWFTPLASLTDPATLADHCCRILGLRDEPGRTTTQTLVHHLSSHSALVVLDNCEHLAGACGALAAALLRECPALHVLSTSREPLGASGEQIRRIGTLPTPDREADREVAEILRFEAVQLFVDRAARAKPSFRLTLRDGPAVARICRRVDGIPLAIELAAARVRTLSPIEIAERLEEGFLLLTGGAIDGLPHHRTMAAAISWSHDHLGPGDRRLFRRLAMFEGGFTLDAAVEVCGDGALDVLDDLTSLVDRSLVNPEDRGGRTRYAMLEIVRAYALDRLDEAGERRVLAEAHLRWVAALAARAGRELTGPDQAAWLDVLESERANLLAALGWSLLASSTASTGLEIATGVWRFWYVRGYLAESRSWLERTLAHATEAPNDARAKALNCVGVIAKDQGDYGDARAFHERARATFRELGDRAGEAASLHYLGVVAYEQGNHQAARECYEAALTVRREVGDRREIAVSLYGLGMVVLDQGEHERARSLLEDALEIFEEIHDARAVAASLYNLGDLADLREDPAALQIKERALNLHRELGDRQGVAYSLHSLASSATRRGDLHQARALNGEALAIRRELGDRRGMAYSLLNLAGLALHGGEVSRARETCGESLAFFHDLDVASGTASALETMASIDARDGELDRAAVLLGAAEGLRARMGVPVEGGERERYEDTLSRVRELGERALDEAWRRGRDLAIERAVELAIGARSSGGAASGSS